MSSQFLRSSPLSLHISDLFTPLIYSSSPAEYAHLTNLTSLDSLNPQCFSFYPSEYNALRCAWRACFLRLPQKIPKKSRQTAHMQSFSLSLQFANSLQTVWNCSCWVWNCSCCSCIMLYSLYSRCILHFGVRTKNLHRRSCRQRFQRCLSLEQATNSG